MKKVALVLTIGLVASLGLAYPQSDTEQEVKAVIIESYEDSNSTLVTRMDDYSMHGALEFWSSGGLLQEVSRDASADEYDVLSIQPKHIEVITLVEGQAAVAHYYAEGTMKPKGSAAVAHYLTRATQVFVKENGSWKIRSSHYSPIAGGAGTSQTTLQQ